MKNTYTDDEVKSIMYAIKWKDGFICKVCGGTKARESSRPFEKICSNSKCKKRYPVTSDTPLQDLKMPISTAFEIFIVMQENYLEYYNSDERNIIEELVLKDDNDEDADEFFMTEKEMLTEKKKIKLKHVRARMPLSRLQKRLGFAEKSSAAAYLDKVGSWLPDTFLKECYAEDLWYRGLETEESKKVYTKIFNLLFDWKASDENKAARAPEDIIFILIKGLDPATAEELRQVTEGNYEFSEGYLAQEALKYNNCKEWQLNSPVSYHYAYLNNLIEKFTQHMETSLT